MGTTFNKAIVGLVVPLIVAALAKIGFQADDQTTIVITSIVTSILVYLTPNKSQ